MSRNCNYPEHHDSRTSAALPVGLVVVIGVVAIALQHWRAVAAAIVVAGIVLALVALLMTLRTNHARHFDPELERQALTARQPELQQAALLAELRQLRGSQRAIEPPNVVHQHLHIQVMPDEMQAIARQVSSPEQQGRPW